MARDDGGPAFPCHYPPDSHAGNGIGCMTLLDWFATHAPHPSEERVSLEMKLDKQRNPYNEGHKPKIRGRIEIIADLNYEYAKAMIAARKRAGGENAR
jgi:hypothetical protein